MGRWLDLQASLLGGAAHVARLLAGERTSVFLHCSDGWDRTPQLTSLAMLLCDAHYRSLRGFAALVEKEWLSFGHCFETRAGRRGPASKAAPIFEQFLDAVWQLVRQQPAAFEFGEAALLALAAEARRTDGRGPFRGDSAAERAALAPPTQTVWEVLRSHRGCAGRGRRRAAAALRRAVARALGGALPAGGAAARDERVQYLGHRAELVA